MEESGIYEKLITSLLKDRLGAIEGEYFVGRQRLDSAEAAEYLSRFLFRVLIRVFESLPKRDDRVAAQVKIANEMILWLNQYLNDVDVSENLLSAEGEILTALFETENPIASDLQSHVTKVTPRTGLSQSELFTGSNVGVSLESEIKREILSSNEICWLVSFIKWTGIRIFKDHLFEAAGNGTRFRIISTSYMGATDQKAIDLLAELPNSEVRISYNTELERLHAKAYLFLRNSGFHTGYVGSSNLSRSALTNGLEWNLKITTEEVPHLIEKFQSTFETYWQSPEFEKYEAGKASDKQRLSVALSKERKSVAGDDVTQILFDLRPHAYQEEILDHLQAERDMHHRFRNLVVAATGTGKTIISAFDFHRFQKKDRSAKLLFVSHRKEILIQARGTFRSVLRDHTFGELWVGGSEPEHHRHLFASVQTLLNRLPGLSLTSDYYDFIIIDEVHHIAAKSYRPILEAFEPKILLGLTATPERGDGTDIRDDFCGVSAAELRLPEAVNRRYLCPFQYFAVDDPEDLSQVKWVNGRYDESELNKLFTGNHVRSTHIIRSMHEVVDDIHQIKALAFCVNQDHAGFMAEEYVEHGIKADVLTSRNADQRDILRKRLARKEINILCVVDIFNEGVDIPEIDTVLFLRPTESLTVFLQQLGRGLRLSEGKECLTVLDFVGNARPEYDFSQKFRSLVGKSQTPITEEIENDFPHLPSGCAIILHRQAKEIILENIRKAIANQRMILSRIRQFQDESHCILSLTHFLDFYPQISLSDIYKIKVSSGGGWTRLCIKAGVASGSLDPKPEKAIYQSVSKRLIQSTSRAYLSFVRRLMDSGTWDSSCPLENQMAMMAYYDFWGAPGTKLGFSSIDEAMAYLVRDSRLVSECMEAIDLILAQLDTLEFPMSVPFPSALNVHARYTRDEIFAAFGAHQFNEKSSSREGVAEIKALKCELLFVTLQKTEKKFSPTTLYHDYALSDRLFHWQSQNSARPDHGKGLSYINHKKDGKTVILFVREQSNDASGRAMGFINLGPVNFVSSEGSQPMNIVWKLDTPIPPQLWREAAKLASGG